MPPILKKCSPLGPPARARRARRVTAIPGILAILLAAFDLFGADAWFAGYLPLVGPGTLRFKGSLPPVILTLPPLPAASDGFSSGTNVVSGKPSAAHNEAVPVEIDWEAPALFPDLVGDPETISTNTPPTMAGETSTLNTNATVVTPQMLVPFFKLASPRDSSSRSSLILPLNLAPPTPGLAPSSKATLTDH